MVGPIAHLDVPYCAHVPERRDFVLRSIAAQKKADCGNESAGTGPRAMLQVMTAAGVGSIGKNGADDLFPI